eukprot:CAMPEP_0118925716 /NCGR_PEP_ID=MMETSP1169-20130426/3557_1 /TAXON_ID=36882 /ORGANISM="Pyramimonas obovata, Strain CCMP722" /LENGTH=186 /DNA_ID=CAMNT_0006867093 /DNA_START=107 /DNA_END=667 /DNA_ORIENTATION=-
MTDEGSAGIWAVMVHSGREAHMNVHSIHSTMEEANRAGRLHRNSYFDRECDEMRCDESGTSFEGFQEGHSGFTDAIEILPIKEIKSVKFLKVALKALGVDTTGTRAQLQERLQRLLGQKDDGMGHNDHAPIVKRQANEIGGQAEMIGPNGSETSYKRRKVEQVLAGAFRVFGLSSTAQSGIADRSN